MSEVEITIKGWKEAEAGLRLLVESALPDAIQTLHEVGEEIAETAKKNSPVRTGYMRSQIHCVPKPDGADVRGDAGYTGFVNSGTRKMAPRFFFDNAVGEGITRLVKTYAEKVKE